MHRRAPHRAGQGQFRHSDPNRTIADQGPFVARTTNCSIRVPLTQLQIASRRVAQGDAAAHLATDSTMVEIVGLSRDLENMRGELVGTAERLRAEMQQRQVEQAERAPAHLDSSHRQVVSAMFECTTIFGTGIEVDTTTINLGGRNWQFDQRSEGRQYINRLDR